MQVDQISLGNNLNIQVLSGGRAKVTPPNETLGAEVTAIGLMPGITLTVGPGFSELTGDGCGVDRARVAKLRDVALQGLTALMAINHELAELPLLDMAKQASQNCDPNRDVSVRLVRGHQCPRCDGWHMALERKVRNVVAVLDRDDRIAQSSFRDAALASINERVQAYAKGTISPPKRRYEAVALGGGGGLGNLLAAMSGGGIGVQAVMLTGGPEDEATVNSMLDRMGVPPDQRAAMKSQILAGRDSGEPDETDEERMVH